MMLALTVLACALAAPFVLWAVFASFAAFAPLTLEAILLTCLKHYDIVRDEDGLYLRRFYLTPRHWKRKIFLHHIVRSDTDASAHDHQWDFASFILFGRYFEHVYRPNGPCVRYLAFEGRSGWDVGCNQECRYEVRDAGPGRLLLNKAEHTHWIEIIRPVWSLVFIGEKRRTWGFWVYDPKTGADTWVKWDRYLGISESFDPNDVYAAGPS